MLSIFKGILLSWLKEYKKQSHFTLARQVWDFPITDFPTEQIWYWGPKTESAQPCWWCIFNRVNLTDLCQYILLSQFCKTYLAFRMANMPFLSQSPCLISWNSVSTLLWDWTKSRETHPYSPNSTETGYPTMLEKHLAWKLNLLLTGVIHLWSQLSHCEEHI